MWRWIIMVLAISDHARSDPARTVHFGIKRSRPKVRFGIKKTGAFYGQEVASHKL
jgi:hypothetical protein